MYATLPSNLMLIGQFVNDSFKGAHDRVIRRASSHFFTADGTGGITEIIGEEEGEEGEGPDINDGDRESKDRPFRNTVQHGGDATSDAAIGGVPVAESLSEGKRVKVDAHSPAVASSVPSHPILMKKRSTVGRTMQSIAAKLAAATVSSAGEEVRVARPIMEVATIHTQHTLAFLLFGARIGLAISGLYRVYIVGFILYLLALVGVVVGLLALVELLPSYWCLVGAIAIQPNIFLSCILPLNVSLANRLVDTFDFKYLVSNITMWLLAFCTALDWDMRSAYVIGWYPAMVWVCLIDATPANLRRSWSIRGPGVCLFIGVLLQVGVVLSWVTLSKKTLTVGLITVNLGGVITSCMTPVLCHWSKGTVLTLLHEGRFVVLQSTIDIKKMSRLDFDVLVAIERASKL